jgi:hypothetical protein
MYTKESLTKQIDKRLGNFTVVAQIHNNRLQLELLSLFEAAGLPDHLFRKVNAKISSGAIQICREAVPVHLKMSELRAKHLSQ